MNGKLAGPQPLPGVSGDAGPCTGKLVFSQVIERPPMRTFRRCVWRYLDNHGSKFFTCLDPCLCMAFTQLTYHESLRNTEVRSRAQHNALYRMDLHAAASAKTP